MHTYIYIFILGGDLEHDFCNFPFSWEFHHPNWRTNIFQRGLNHQPVYIYIYVYTYVHLDWFLYLYVYLYKWVNDNVNENFNTKNR